MCARRCCHKQVCPRLKPLQLLFQAHAVYRVCGAFMSCSTPGNVSLFPDLPRAGKRPHLMSRLCSAVRERSTSRPRSPTPQFSTLSRRSCNGHAARFAGLRRQAGACATAVHTEQVQLGGGRVAGRRPVEQLQRQPMAPYFTRPLKHPHFIRPLKGAPFSPLTCPSELSSCSPRSLTSV